MYKLCKSSIWHAKQKVESTLAAKIKNVNMAIPTEDKHLELKQLSDKQYL